MNKKKMLNVIYKKIADKTLSYGCKFTDIYTGLWIIDCTDTIKSNISKGSCTIIWHPVMIWDVLDYITEEFSINMYPDPDYVNELLTLYEHKRKSIDEQSKECIIYVFDLINNEM